jgi:hypothetical protein
MVEKPTWIGELEDILLMAILFVTLVTWVCILLRLLMG